MRYLDKNLAFIFLFYGVIFVLCCLAPIFEFRVYCAYFQNFFGFGLILTFLTFNYINNGSFKINVVSVIFIAYIIIRFVFYSQNTGFKVSVLSQTLHFINLVLLFQIGKEYFSSIVAIRRLLRFFVWVACFLLVYLALVQSASFVDSEYIVFSGLFNLGGFTARKIISIVFIIFLVICNLINDQRKSQVILQKLFVVLLALFVLISFRRTAVMVFFVGALIFGLVVIKNKKGNFLLLLAVCLLSINILGPILEGQFYSKEENLTDFLKGDFSGEARYIELNEYFNLVEELDYTEILFGTTFFLETKKFWSSISYNDNRTIHSDGVLIIFSFGLIGLGSFLWFHFRMAFLLLRKQLICSRRKVPIESYSIVKLGMFFTLSHLLLLGPGTLFYAEQSFVSFLFLGAISKFKV